MLWTIIVAIIVGAIIGALARLVLPGRQSISMVVTIILGILGSLIGSWIYASLGGGETNGIDWIANAIGVVCAAALIVIYGMVTGRKQV
ncbi:MULTISPECIES: GlsB/YeaQ/YmgE family stress response membrane protein [Janibacter]|uniref:GlsB/YeaQ/YmgE family stress response membrane protein n=1 Tax=Janibacter melonis TaxID=262209 RepID=A0A5P8FNM6_9MICO|nr:GlsB/YeaQ/YmgE family stress response membrane protein [Janibacter melonis]MCB5990904.1 GlsB/YeaQ/YmgE family stress response membrane protein [Janibacter melonis]QFQ30733.1 GlsB/YeaQ/YmgE family stress response membrane protein [Janibacter melonis]